jgi:hypothetical protein
MITKLTLSRWLIDDSIHLGTSLRYQDFPNGKMPARFLRMVDGLARKALDLCFRLSGREMRSSSYLRLVLPPISVILCIEDIFKFGADGAPDVASLGPEF